MNVERRRKYSGSGRTVDKSGKKLDINFDLNSLNLMCSYILSENKNIRRSHLLNMRNLFELLDINIYINDIEKMKRIDFIKRGLEAKIIHNLKDAMIIIKYINGGIIEETNLDIRNFTELSNNELEWINSTITEALKYAFIYNDIDKMLDICTRFKAADYRSRGSIVQEFENLVIDIQTKFRRSRVESLSETNFTLKNGLFEEVVRDIHQQLTDPSSRLLTGMQGVNELLGGGFESARVYMLLGLTGGGKSLSLLNFAYQLKKNNKLYKPKDPTKIPVIVYLTMENTVKETVERLFNLTTGLDMKDVTPEEAIDLLRTDGELYLTDDSPVDIVIKFVPNRSVDTGYLYTMTEDLEDEGYEVICLIQDHVKRIKSVDKYTDVRLELGAVVNEFKVFASIKDIPVITNSHLNRDAAGKIDEASKANKGDLIRMLGRANIGESMLMLDNLDCAFIIGQEYDSQCNKYMGFKRIKMRGKCTLRDTIFQPYTSAESIKLIEDIDLSVPVFKDTLKDSPTETNLYNNGTNRSKYQNNIKDIDDIMKEKKSELFDEENIFSSNSRYMSNNINTIQHTTVDVNNIPVVSGKRHANNSSSLPNLFRRVM